MTLHHVTRMLLRTPDPLPLFGRVWEWDYSQIRWGGGSRKEGRLYSVDWTRDWTVGLDWGTGLTESCAHPISKPHTHYYTTVYLHHMNWIQGRRPSLDININRTRRSFSSHFCRYQCVLYKCVPACKPNKHWPLSNGNTVNLHSRTLILSSKQVLPSGKSTHVCLRWCRSQTESG